MIGSNLTYKILAFSEMDEANSDDTVDWANEMILLGFESPGLFILASFVKPVNYSEVSSYLKTTLNELGLEVKTGTEALMSYTTFYVIEISEGRNIRTNLAELTRLVSKYDYNGFIYNFYLLFWAWDDLDYDPDYTHYWENANRANISSLVVEEARKWLKENLSPN